MALMIGLGCGLGACGGDPASEPSQQQSTPAASATSASTDATPALCGDLDRLQASATKLQKVKLDRDALPVVSAELRNIKAEVRQLGNHASAEYADEIATVKARAADLELSVKAASAAPSKATLSAVRDDLRAFGASVRDLGTAVGTTC